METIATGRDDFRFTDPDEIRAWMRDTFPKLVRANAERFPRKIAIREKDYGIWQSYTWCDYKEFYLGLTGVGQRRSYRDVKHYRRRKRWLS